MKFSEEIFATIASLDLEPIKVKLMHKESGEGWSLERATEVESEYRRFLYLMKAFPNEQAAPKMDVDTFWHYHILDTLKYAQDCQTAFGYFLHHFPYVGLRGGDDLLAHERMGERMRILYETTFGEKYPGSATKATAWSGATKATAYCGATGANAYCGATRANAYCGATRATAYCGATSAIAYCGATGTTGYSTVPTRTASSGATADTTYCGAMNASEKGSASANAAEQDFFSTRPRLPAVAVS